MESSVAVPRDLRFVKGYRASMIFGVQYSGSLSVFNTSGIAARSSIGGIMCVSLAVTTIRDVVLFPLAARTKLGMSRSDAKAVPRWFT